MRFSVILVVLCLAAGAGAAQERSGVFAASLVVGGVVQDGPARSGGSLFAGREAGGLFAPVTPRINRTSRLPDVTAPGGRRGNVARLRDLIASAEAGRSGYDAVQYGARIKPPRRPTALTLAEIETWTRNTPGQPHAIGRYQFIPKTLRRLVRDLGVPPDAVFTPDLQDQLADLLLAEAGLGAFLAGQMPRRVFMNNLAKIWAGLPNDSGRSHYHGFAGNKAVISWSAFEAGMVAIFG